MLNIDQFQLHAGKTENFLVGKSLFEPNQLRTALEILSSELNPDHVLPDYTPEYRKHLALSLFYKVCAHYYKKKL